MFAADLPVADLASPSQEKRDAAAKVIRENYVAPTKESVKAALASIQVGDRRSKILRALVSFGIPMELPEKSAGTSFTSYRLNDRWVLECTFQNEVLQDVALMEDEQEIEVHPPERYTGDWTTYYANGQRCHEAHFLDGVYTSELTTFRADGTRSRVQNFGPDGLDGEEIGYYPSGTVSYRGKYKAGRKVGTWTWYKEDGSVRSTKEERAS